MVVMATCENVLDCGIYILRCSKIGNLPSNGAVRTKSTWIFLVSSRMFWNKNYNIEKKKKTGSFGFGKKCTGCWRLKCNVRSQTQWTVSDFSVKLQAEEESPSMPGSRASNRSSESHQQGKVPGGWGVASRAGQTGIRALPLHAVQWQIPVLKRNPDVAAKQKPSMPNKTEISAQVHSEGKQKWWDLNPQTFLHLSPSIHSF